MDSSLEVDRKSEMFEPKNEQGVVALFCMIAGSNGWEVEEIQTEYPDARIKKDGTSWMVEFEYKSANFIQHGHDIRECDMIICWKHNYKNCPIPVIELSKQIRLMGITSSRRKTQRAQSTGIDVQ